MYVPPGLVNGLARRTFRVLCDICPSPHLSPPPIPRWITPSVPVFYKPTLKTEEIQSVLLSVIKDLGIAVRALRNRPGYTALVVLTLSLGIGATSSIFSVVSSVLLTPLPYADADRLVFFRLYAGDFNGSEWASMGELRDFNESESLEEVAGVSGGFQGYVEVDDQIQSVSIGTASVNLYASVAGGMNWWQGIGVRYSDNTG